MVYDHHEPARVLSRRLHRPERSAGEHEELIEVLARHDAIRRHRQQGLQRVLAARRDKKEQEER